MNNEATLRTERCAVCGGELQGTIITHEEKRGEQLYLFEHVPAQRCATCGELWIAERTLCHVDQLIQEGTPVRTVQTPVYEFVSGDAQ